MLFWFITYRFIRMSAKNLITVEALEGILDDELKPMLSTMDELKGTFQFLSDKFDLIIKKVQKLKEKLLITDQENKHRKTEVSRLSTLGCSYCRRIK